MMHDLLIQTEFGRIEVPADHFVVRVHLIGKLLYVLYVVVTMDNREHRMIVYDWQGNVLLRGEPLDRDERFWICRDWDDEGFVIYTHDSNFSQYCLIDGKQFGPCRNIEAYRVEWSSRWSVTQQNDEGVTITYSSGKTIGPFKEVCYISGDDDDTYYWVTRDDGCYLCSERDGLIEGPFNNDSRGIRESKRYDSIEVLRTPLFMTKLADKRRLEEKSRVSRDIWTIRFKDNRPELTLYTREREYCPVQAVDSHWPVASLTIEDLNKLIYPFQFLYQDQSYLMLQEGRVLGPYRHIDAHWFDGPVLWLVEKHEDPDDIFDEMTWFCLYRDGLNVGEFSAWDHLPHDGIMVLAHRSGIITLHR